MSTIEGISAPMLKKYVTMRKGVGEKAQHAGNLAYILSLLEHCDEDMIPVDPKVLAAFADEINSDVCSMLEQLDEFIFIVNAEQALAS